MPHHILYIEDNGDDFDLLSEALREIGADVVVERIPDGLAARARFQQFATLASAPPALLLIDLNLPQIDGMSILTEAKAVKTLAMVPMIMLTSSTSPVDRQRCAAADGYLAKGSRWNETVALAKTLHALLPQGRSP